VKNYQIIKIGDVSLSFLRASNHAKSALDGGWGLLKAQSHTKGRRAGRLVNDVLEKYSTQTGSGYVVLAEPSMIATVTPLLSMPHLGTGGR
jgi:hypothetical protein